MWVAIGIVACVVLGTVISFGIWKLNQLDSGPKPKPPPLDTGRPTWLEPGYIPDKVKPKGPTASKRLNTSATSIPHPAHTVVHREKLIDPVLSKSKRRVSEASASSQKSAAIETQREFTRKTAMRLANKAMADISKLLESERIAWYGNLNMDRVHRIANGTIDPLSIMLKEHEIREIPRKYQGKVGDFMNLGLSLHHFSATSNRRSIEEHGLLSMSRARGLGIAPVVVSSKFSRERDEYLNLDQYVHLSFTSRSAMAYAVESRSNEPLADYRISPMVLNIPSTMFCRGYANARDARWIPIQEITPLDLIALFLGFDRMKYWQLMVEGTVSNQYFRRDTRSARSESIAQWL